MKDLARVSARLSRPTRNRLQPLIGVVTKKSQTLRVPRVESRSFFFRRQNVALIESMNPQWQDLSEALRRAEKQRGFYARHA